MPAPVLALGSFLAGIVFLFVFLRYRKAKALRIISKDVRAVMGHARCWFRRIGIWLLTMGTLPFSFLFYLLAAMFYTTVHTLVLGVPSTVRVRFE